MKSPGPASATNSSRSPQAHPSATAYHVDHALDRTMMVRTGLRVRLDVDRPGPQLAGTRARGRDRRHARHPRRLRGVRVELVGVNDPNAAKAPVGIVGRAVHRPDASLIARGLMVVRIRDAVSMQIEVLRAEEGNRAVIWRLLELYQY